MIVIIMGISGSGKTTVGQLLTAELFHHMLFEQRLQMDLSKLKLGKLTKIKALNFPSELQLGVTASKTLEVLIYFISKPYDVDLFVEACRKAKLPQDNRVVIIYQKGNKTVNRDVIIAPFREGLYRDFKLKAPILCSLSDSLSAFVMQKI